MAPLQRAFALEQVNHFAMPVADDLHLDVTPALDKGFDDQRRVAKGALGFAHGRLDGLHQSVQLLHHPHALAAATGGRLQNHRQR